MAARYPFGALAAYAFFAALAWAVPVRTDAQQLPRLHVIAFTLTSDAAGMPRTEQPFHLVVDVRVAGRASGFSGVVLPPLGPLEIRGDETHVVRSATHTEYREILTVVSHQGGELTIPPAYLDAIDARDGKAKRFLSNALTVRIAGLLPGRRFMTAITVQSLQILAGMCIVFGLGLAVVLRRSMPSARRAIPPVAPTEATDVAKAPQNVDEALAAGRDALQAAPTRETAVAVRQCVWCALGARPGETLTDVLRRPNTRDPRLRAVLGAVERAAFTYDDALSPALSEAAAAMNAYLLCRTGAQ